ncbi:MAG TPA: PA domain-containing protein [Myxococcaceae bacterium]|nr:PA domain-containing protein [Myxococcaceae bacterium]
MTPGPLRALCLAALVASPVALGGAEIRIVDGNGSGEGLDDRTPADPVGGNPGTTLGEQRLMAAQYAAALWSATLGNQVSIAIRTEFADLDCSGGTAVLGAAGPTLLYDGNRYPAALANERAGRDLDPGREEIDARFNARVGSSGCPVTAWYSGLDNQAPTGTTDLPSVLLHEMAHGLGFIKSATVFRDQAQDDTSGVLLSQLSESDYAAAIRRPLGVSWIGPAVRASKDAILDKTDGLLRLPDGRTLALARARFGPGHVSLTAPVVLAQDADGGTGHDACGPLAASPGALVLAERGLRSDAGLFCFVAQRALNAQAAGAVGLLVRPLQPGIGPTSYTGDAGTELSIPVWGLSSEDGAFLEAYVSGGGEQPVAVDGDGRRAGENLVGDVLLYTPSTYSDGSSVGHWDSSASPPLLMMPIINPSLPRDLDLTPAALRDVGWTLPAGLSIGATTLGRDLDDGRPPRFIVHVVNRGATLASGVVLDARADPALRLVSTELSCAGGACSTGPLDCAAGLPCALGEIAPGAVRTVIARYAFAGTALRQAAVQFRITAGSPEPAARDATTTAVATRASSCSSTGTGPGGTLALLAVAAWVCRRQVGVSAVSAAFRDRRRSMSHAAATPTS